MADEEDRPLLDEDDRSLLDDEVGSEEDDDDDDEDRLLEDELPSLSLLSPSSLSLLLESLLESLPLPLPLPLLEVLCGDCDEVLDWLVWAALVVVEP